MKLLELSASAAVAAIDAGQTTSEELVKAYIDQINAYEELVGAWAHFDVDQALAQAKEADLLRKTGRKTGPLQGIPIGVKDVFDTHDYPTEDGGAVQVKGWPATHNDA